MKKIGLTEGEIKVYSALISLGKAPIFRIMKMASVSSSKVYLILEKLIQKGIVNFSVENGVKNFEISNPNVILDYVSGRKSELDDFSRSFEKLIPEINGIRGSFESESAQVYTGVRGISAAFENILNELKKGDSYYFFSISSDELSNEHMKRFFSNWHLKRISKGIKVKGIVHSSLSAEFVKEVLHKDYQVKRRTLTMPTGVIIGKNRILIPIWGEENMCYELVSKRVVEKYTLFFENVWKE